MASHRNTHTLETQTAAGVPGREGVCLARLPKVFALSHRPVVAGLGRLGAPLRARGRDRSLVDAGQAYISWALCLLVFKRICKLSIFLKLCRGLKKKNSLLTLVALVLALQGGGVWFLRCLYLNLRGATMMPIHRCFGFLLPRDYVKNEHLTGSFPFLT